ncbi:hypothetical protein CsSME_00005941 [Camellia sinensis var. sinensis]
MSSSSSSSDKVRASHILIKHQGSRRKASWKDPEGRIITNTTRDAAVSQLKSLRDDIVSGKSKFDDVASRFSDCSSAKRGGDLGQFFSCHSILLFVSLFDTALLFGLYVFFCSNSIYFTFCLIAQVSFSFFLFIFGWVKRIKTSLTKIQ